MERYTQLLWYICVCMCTLRKSEEPQQRRRPRPMMAIRSPALTTRNILFISTQKVTLNDPGPMRETLDSDT